MKRIIGNISNADGPTVIFFGGVHGNEPAGLAALQNVFHELETRQVKINGRAIGLAGNLPALRANKRFIARDLNRIWTAESLARIRNGNYQNGLACSAPTIPEYAEQLELFEAISGYLTSESPTYFIDLHTTSSKSAPFVAINDQLKNREFAFQFPVPVVLGIEEYLNGTLLNLVNEYGHVAVAFEAGQHDDPQSEIIHSSFVYLALCAVGVIREEDIDNYQQHKDRITSTGKAHRGAYEVVFRKRVTQHDDFKMNLGYRNFAAVAKQEIVGRDCNGPVRASVRGKIFMPLYQADGEDGFFIVRNIPNWALVLSAVLRRVDFEKLLTLLPGVARDPAQPDALIVDRKIARFLATQLFHLLGYRRKQIQGEKLVFSRREIT